MIDVWLKVKNRNNLNQVLKNLNFWLGLFSDYNKYKIHLYSEDLELPRFYSCYNILNRHHLLSNFTCREIEKTIARSVISPNWKATAFALAAPYFYLQQSPNKYLINLDADDMIMYGSVENYLDQITKLFDEQGSMTTISYDYLLSKNIFERKNTMPHHWSFGINFSAKDKMPALLLNLLHNSHSIARRISNVNYGFELNLDILMSQYLLENNYLQPYHSFITKAGMLHSNHNFHFFIRLNEQGLAQIFFDQNGQANTSQHIKHPKTLEIF